MYEVYGTITKKSLLDKANIVKERFNNANFKSKSTNSIQHINKVEVIEHEDHIDISDFIVKGN